MSVNTDIRELFDRIRALEANVAGSGIQFNTFPQGGDPDWLYVETNDSGFSGPNGFGMELHDYTAGGLGVGIISDVNLVSLRGLGINIEQYADPDVTTGNIDSKLIMSSFGGVELSTGLFSPTISMRLAAAKNVGVDFNTSGLGTGKFIISENGLTIFEFWADGSVHGLAAVGAITWDL